MAEKELNVHNKTNHSRRQLYIEIQKQAKRLRKIFKKFKNSRFKTCAHWSTDR
jgi:hypothetical protein